MPPLQEKRSDISPKKCEREKYRNDLRVAKTIDTIRETFRTMLCEVGYKRISVKELCERARINKKTFYRYYDSLDELMRELQEDTMERYTERISDLCAPDSLADLIEDFFAFAEEEGLLFERMTLDFVPGSVEGIPGDEAILAAWKKDGRIDEQDLITVLSFISTAVLSNYVRWIKTGKQMPLERISALTSQLVCGGVESHLGVSRT